MKTRISQIIRLFGIVAFVAAFAAAAFPAPGFAASAPPATGKNMGKIEIAVRDAASPSTGPRPIVGAGVVIFDTNGVVVKKSTTDAQGNASFALPVGTYEIHVSAPGYNPGVAKVAIRAQVTQDVVIRMTRPVNSIPTN